MFMSVRTWGWIRMEVMKKIDEKSGEKRSFSPKIFINSNSAVSAEYKNVVF